MRLPVACLPQRGGVPAPGAQLQQALTGLGRQLVSQQVVSGRHQAGTPSVLGERAEPPS
jgi:hypothetical protein